MTIVSHAEIGLDSVYGESDPTRHPSSQPFMATASPMLLESTPRTPSTVDASAPSEGRVDGAREADVL